MIRIVWIVKSWWLLHVDNFQKLTMQNHIVDIKLTNVPTVLNGKCKN